MTDQAIVNASTKRRRKRRLIIALAAAGIALLAGGGVGLAWFTDYGTAMAHTIAPLHDDKWLNHVIPNMFSLGMTRKEIDNVIEFGIVMKVDEAASTPNRLVGVIPDQRNWFRPNPAPALRVEIDFDQNDKVIATRWSRITESR